MPGSPVYRLPGLGGLRRRLLHSAKFEIIGDGQGVERPKLDEYISVDGVLHGVPSGRPKRSFIWEALRNRATRGKDARR
jgi:hypothetical protein